MRFVPSRRPLSPAALLAAVLPILLAAWGCGSSATTTTAPAPASRCEITLGAGQSTLPAAGGSGVISVTATRECTWSAAVEGAWLSIRSGASGQGEGRVEFAASANPDPQARAGALVVNGSRTQITQSAAECVLSLASSAAEFPQTGGTERIAVRASSSLCAWTATSDSSWIEITSGASGRGEGGVTIVVGAWSGPPRTGSLTIAGQRFSVTQSQGCGYAIDRPSQSFSPSGGSGSIAVTTAPACPWTAASNVPWLTVTPTTASGPGAVGFTVAATSGPLRIGTAVIAGQLFTVTQSPGCAFQVAPTSHTIAASGGTASVNVSTATGCTWTATTNQPWITIQGPTGDTGSGTITFAVAATTGPPRSGSLTVAGQQVVVSQSQGCTFSIAPQRQSVSASGGTGRVGVTAGAGCAWTAASNAPWVTITSGANGNGNGEVQFTAAATSGPPRSATLTIAGQTFTVDQGTGCTAQLSPASLDVSDAGGQRTFDVQTGAGCAWTAATTTPWITITSGASGSGNGTVHFTVTPNSGPGRSGSITAAGQTFTVTQGTGCSVSISPDRQDVPAAGAAGTVNVTAGTGCSWTSSSNAPWLTITSGASGSGNGAVGFTAAANAGPARSGTLTIAGRTFTVNQSEACSFTIDPTQQAVPAAGGNTDVTVRSSNGCAWSATSNAPWITISSGNSGSGNGTVRMTLEPNAGAARSGTVTIAGQTFTLSQAGGCSFTVAPETVAASSTASTQRVEVTTSSGCAWTATSNAAWITVSAGASGAASGPVDLALEANTGAARSGTVTVAGRTVTVTQEAAPAPACTITLTPASQENVPATGVSGSTAVSAPAGCAWAATPSAAWIRITSGASGSGDGMVQFTVDPNATGAPRSGTIAIGGATFTVNQQ